MIKLTIFALVTLCLAFANGDGQEEMENDSTKCGQLRKNIIIKIVDVQADGHQASCAFKRTTEIVSETFKEADSEMNCADACKKLKELMKEEDEQIIAMFNEVKEKLPVKSWLEKLGQHFEGKKNKNDERTKMIDEEGKKCHDCTMKNIQVIEKKCEEMNAEDLVNSVKSSCGI